MKIFDGKNVRDEILADLKDTISKMSHKPVLAVFLIGDNPVSSGYVALKRKVAEELGIKFDFYHLPADVAEKEVTGLISDLNQNKEVDGIMVQIPVPEHLGRNRIIKAIAPDKDIDGLRFCLGLPSDFVPPVVLAIAKALNLANADIENSSIALVGRGFLVGDPLFRFLKKSTKKLIVCDHTTVDLASVTRNANIVISAVGKANLITKEMIKDGAILIDAGTSESGGQLKGDIDSAVYDKASFYTPVPGGIGPVTLAMLMFNLVTSSYSSK